MKLLTIFLSLCLGQAAMAGIISFNLTQETCTTGCSVLPGGTITVESFAADDVLVTVQLGPDYSFRGSNDANHHALVFNLGSLTSVVISGIISGDTTSQIFALSQTGTFDQAGFGSFEYALECTTCSPGMAGVTTRSLSFHLQAPGLTELSFTPTNSAMGNVYFSVDVVGKTADAGVGLTGNLGALEGAAVPEPGSTAMMVSGLLAVLAGGYRRKKSHSR